MSPSTRGSAAERIEVEPDVLIRAGRRLGTVGVQLGLIADLVKPMLANGIASGWDAPGLNFGLEYSDFAGVLAPGLAAAANGCKATGLMLQVSGHNYANADAASTLPGGAPVGSVGDTPAETVAASIPAGPNGIAVFPPGAWAAIYPVIQFFGGLGMTWPLGDPTFMRVLAAQWETIGTGANLFSDDIDAIKTVVSMQDIPERDRMLEDLQTLDRNLAELATGASDLGKRIRDFAQGVEDAQNAIRRLLDRVSSLDSIIDTLTGLFSGEAAEIASDILAVLRNFQRQVKGIVGLLGQGKQSVNDALTAFQELNRRFLIATFGDDLGATLADGFDHYTDVQVGVLNGAINAVSGTVSMLDADTWKGMYDVAARVAGDPSQLDDVLLATGKQFIAWDALTGDHPGRGVGEAAFNIVDVLRPGGALSKTGTLADGLRYGRTLAREGRLPRLSDLPGVGGRHTPSFEVPPGRGTPEPTGFAPGGVPNSLTTGPHHVDPLTTPRELAGPPDPSRPEPTPGAGHRGPDGGDDPPGGGGRPVGPPDSTTGPSSSAGPSTPAPTHDSSPAPSTTPPEASPPGTYHAPEISGAAGTHDGDRSPVEHHVPSEQHLSTLERTQGGHAAGDRAADPPAYQPHTPAAEHHGTIERGTPDGGQNHEQSHPPNATAQHQPAAAGVMATAMGPMGAGAHAPTVSHSPSATPPSNGLNRTPESRGPYPGAPENPRTQTPSTAGSGNAVPSTAPVSAGGSHPSAPNSRPTPEPGPPPSSRHLPAETGDRLFDTDPQASHRDDGNSGNADDGVGGEPPPPLHRDPPYPHTGAVLERFAGEQYPGGPMGHPGVTYLDDDQRELHRITIRNGHIYDADCSLFDTTGGVSAFGPSHAGRAIFVMDHHGNLYASTHHEFRVFHHSSFLAGGEVAGAGEIIVKNGRLELLSDSSGHYRPGHELTQQVLDQLASQGIHLGPSQISVTQPPRPPGIP